MDTKRQEKTERLYSKIKADSKQIDITSKDRADKNQSLKLAKSEFKPLFLDSDKISRITINNETNSINLNLYNGFILAVMSNIYDVDFNALKSRLISTSEFICFNRIISAELKNNQKPFMTAL